MPGDPMRAFASMGNYIFDAAALREAVSEDAADEGSKHDMGGNIVPRLVARGQAAVYDFATNEVPGQNERERGYWRDVGTLDAYYHASLDLVAVAPTFDLYNEEWPIRTWGFPHPPAKFVHESGERVGHALNSLVCNGAIVSGATVRRSILSPLVRVNSFALVEDSVLFDNVEVGRGAVVRNAVIDKNVKIPPGYRLGVDPAADSARFTLSESGVVVIGKGEILA